MITAGIDCGAKNTKTVIIKDGQILAKASVQTGFDQKKAVEESFHKALEAAGMEQITFSSFTDFKANKLKRTSKKGKP